MGISLDKVEKTAPGLVNLVKKADSALDRRGLRGATAAVALCIDYSGSMRGRYNSGEVQELAERSLALATQFDDDGAIDVFAFDYDAEYLGTLTLENYRGGIDRLTRNRRYGSTNYAAAFEEVSRHFDSGTKKKRGLFSRNKADEPVMPVFSIFITDGAPDNRSEAKRALQKVSGNPIFWKFLSLGQEKIEFLEKLDELNGRVIDNANYQAVGELSRLSDDTLFDYILEEYSDWLSAAKSHHII